MVDSPKTNKNQKNYVELTEAQIFEKIKKDLTPIQENLSEKKITIDEAKSELKKINERLQGTKLENKDKKDLGEAFNRLEENIDENNSKIEFNEVVNLLEKLTKKDLAKLSQEVQQNKPRWNPERPTEIQIGIDKSSNNLEATIHNATQDSNPIAKKIGQRMKNLMS